MWRSVRAIGKRQLGWAEDRRRMKANRSAGNLSTRFVMMNGETHIHHNQQSVNNGWNEKGEQNVIQFSDGRRNLCQRNGAQQEQLKASTCFASIVMQKGFESKSNWYHTSAGS